MDKQHSENMGRLSSNMNKSNCISGGFHYQQLYGGYNPSQQSRMLFNPLPFLILQLEVQLLMLLPYSGYFSWHKNFKLHGLKFSCCCFATKLSTD